MRSLLLFFFRYRAFITFIFLEIISIFLIVQNTHYQKALFFNSSNQLIGGILNLSNNVTSFIDLSAINDQLALENAQLSQQIAEMRIESPSLAQVDTFYHYEFRTAEVVNNTVRLRNNTLTIRIGAADGVKEGMGVIGGGGVVGKVRYVNNNYSVVTSLLHTDGMLSAQVKNKVGLCTVSWGGPFDSNVVELLYIPRQYQIKEGDTVLTSGYNAIFPAGIFVGTISEVSLTDEATFYDVKVRLGNDFHNLSHVSVIENRDLVELDSLSMEIRDE